MEDYLNWFDMSDACQMKFFGLAKLWWSSIDENIRSQLEIETCDIK